MLFPSSRPSVTKLLAVATFAAALPLTAFAALTSGPTSTVVYVGGNDLVIKSAEGKLLNYTVPSSYHFSAGGKDMTIGDLKPGTSLSKPVAPGTDPKLVSSVEVVKGKVYSSAPPDGLTLSLSQGVKELTVPAGTTFMVDGKPKSISEIKPDMMVEATVITTAGEADAAAAAAAPVTPPLQGALLVAQAANSGDLPDSGTNLPLVGILGVSLLGIGTMLLRFRKTGSAV